jgi:hypothetical protein
VVSYDVVRAEAAAVRELAAVITRYAEHLRSAADGARRDARHQRESAEQEAQRRRAVMDRAKENLNQARAALSRCRENCGGLQQAVNQAQQRFNQAEQHYRAASRAVGMIAGAETELLRSLHAAESIVTEHASVSVKALTELEGRIRAYASRRHEPPAGLAIGRSSSDAMSASSGNGQGTGGGHANALQNIAITLEVLRGLTGAGHGLAAAGFVPPTAEPISISAQAEDLDRVGQLQEQYSTELAERLRDSNEQLGRRSDGT